MKTLAAMVVWLFVACTAWADTYYCAVLAYDSKPVPLPCQCHIFGTFVQVDDNGKLVEEVTLSWAPDKTHYLDFYRPGYNMTLSESLESGRNKTMRAWGPYEIDKDFFLKAKSQHQTCGQYKFIDGFWRKRSQNCIHRLSDVAGKHRTGVYWGWWAADSVVRHYQRHNLIRPTDRREEIHRLLGLHQYNMKRM